MSRQSKRIFQEHDFIEQTIVKHLLEYSPSGDEDFDLMVREHLLRDVSERADSFMLSLYDIAHDMTFTEWNDFWFDMGVRIFGEDDEPWECYEDFEIDEDDFAC